MKRMVVMGNAGALREAIVEALEGDEIEVKVIEPSADDPFGEAAGHAAVVHVAGADAPFDAALSAAHAPGVEVLVVVMPASGGDADIERLKRDGVPYVVLRTPRLVEELEVGERRWWVVPRDARVCAIEAEAVARAVRQAVDSEEQGRVLALGEELPAAVALRRAAELRGLDARVVALWSPLVLFFYWLMRLLRQEPPPALLASPS